MTYIQNEYPMNLVPCHNDLKLNNFLKNCFEVFLLDWEYSGMCDLYFDLVNFVMTNTLNVDEEALFLNKYIKESQIVFNDEKYLLYKICTDYLWIHWHLIKFANSQNIVYNEKNGKNVLIEHY